MIVLSIDITKKIKSNWTILRVRRFGVWVYLVRDSCSRIRKVIRSVYAFYNLVCRCPIASRREAGLVRSDQTSSHGSDWIQSDPIELPWIAMAGMSKLAVHNGYIRSRDVRESRETWTKYNYRYFNQISILRNYSFLWHKQNIYTIIDLSLNLHVYPKVYGARLTYYISASYSLFDVRFVAWEFLFECDSLKYFAACFNVEMGEPLKGCTWIGNVWRSPG